MTLILKKLDYEDLAQRIVDIESQAIIEGQIRTYYSYCYIFTDTSIDLKKLGNIIENVSKKQIDTTGKDYIKNRKRHLSISTNLLTRVYVEEVYKNKSCYADSQYDTQFRAIYKFGDFVQSLPFNIIVNDLKNYFTSHQKGGKNCFMIDTANIVNSDKIEELAPYKDIVNKGRWIYNTKYHFDFQVDIEMNKGKLFRSYSVPLKIFNDIYAVSMPEKSTNCAICNSSLFGKYYIARDKSICRFCMHFSSYKLFPDEEIVFVDDNGLNPTDIGFNEIMNARNFVKKNGYYTNDEHILYPGAEIDYVFDKKNINPAVNGKTKKIILVKIIEY